MNDQKKHAEEACSGKLAPRTSFVTAGCVWSPAKATHEGQLLSSHVQHLEEISILHAVALVLLPAHDSDAILGMEAAQDPHRHLSHC